MGMCEVNAVFTYNIAIIDQEKLNTFAGNVVDLIESSTACFPSMAGSLPNGSLRSVGRIKLCWHLANKLTKLHFCATFLYY